MRIALHVLGMFLLGAAALTCVGLLYNARMNQRVPASAALPAPGPTGTSGSSAGTSKASVDAALAGIRADLDFFADAIRDGRRSDAMRVLDGAYHVADVIRSASDRNPVATDLFDAVSSIRRAVQNGDDSDAIARARAASQRVAKAARLAARRPSRLEPFVGATVISSTGDNLGTVSNVSTDTVEAESGGLRNLLGFIDLQSGTIRAIPADAVVFGEPRRFGMTMVLDASR